MVKLFMWLLTGGLWVLSIILQVMETGTVDGRATWGIWVLGAWVFYRCLTDTPEDGVYGDDFDEDD